MRSSSTSGTTRPSTRSPRRSTSSAAATGWIGFWAPSTCTEEWDRHIVFNNAAGPCLGFPCRASSSSRNQIMDTDSLSWFLDATWEVTDRARVSAGVRRTEDEIDEYHFNQALLPLFNAAFTSCDKAEQLDWSATTIRLVGQYDVNDNGNVYVSYTEGYKAGGVAPIECNVPYEPETVDAYELGYKATFGGSDTLSAAAFYLRLLRLPSVSDNRHQPGHAQRGRCGGTRPRTGTVVHPDRELDGVRGCHAPGHRVW